MHAKHTEQTRKAPTFHNPNNETSRLLVPPNGNKHVKYNHQRRDPRGSTKNHPRDQRQPAGSIKGKRNNMGEPTGRSVTETDAGNTKRKKQKITTTPEGRYPGKESERMGKGREGTPLGAGERKNPTGYRSLPKANSRAAGGTGQKLENNPRPRNECRKPEKDDRKLGIHARKSGKRGEDPPSSNGEIQGPQKRCISKKTSLRPVRPVRLTHLAHRTSIAN